MVFRAEDMSDGPRRGEAPARRDEARVARYQGPVKVVHAPVEVLEREDEDSGFDLLRYWNMVLKHRWLLAGALALGLAAGAVVTLLTTPVYRASATVQIDEEPAKVVAVESQRPTQAPAAEKFYQTQYELLQSRALAQRVVAHANLANDEGFLNQWKKLAPTDAQGRLASPKTAAERTARTNQATALVSAHLHIEPIRQSRIVRISYESPDAEIAARVANAVAASYINWNLERRYNASTEARRFLESRLRQTREALEAAQRRGNDYAQRNQLITIESGDTGPDGGPATGESLVAADLASINAQLAQATTARIQAEQRWRQALSTPDMALPEILSNAAIQTLKAQRDAAWSTYQQDLRVYKPDWPTMVDARKKIEGFDQQLAAQAAAIRNTLKTELDVARKNEAQFQVEVERRKGELLESQGKRVEQGFINTDIMTSKSLYDGMLASYKEIGLAGAIGENNISFVDQAQRPGQAIKPQPVRNLMQFGLLGLVLGGLAAFALDRFDLSVKVPEDVEKELGLPLLGAVPVSREMSASRALENPKSAISEAYYSVRTALQFSTEDGAPSSLLVTSTQPAEGKTTSSLAIASGFGRLGLRVLLVDGDLRDPSLHKILSRDNGMGLSNLLAGGPDMAPALQPTSFQNLTFLACGPLPPNPAELLGGGKMRAFLAAARREFDLVVIDGPPVMGLADAPLLASLVGGTVYVVEAGETKRDIAKASIRRLRAGNAHLLGAVLTKFDLRKAGYAYGHAYGYGYGHGYGLDYGAAPQPKAGGAGLLAKPGWLSRAGRRRA